MTKRGTGPGIDHFPVKVEQRLGRLLLSRLESILDVMLGALRSGTRPLDALDAAQRAFADAPHETARIGHLAELANKHGTLVLRKELQRQLGGKRPTSRAPKRPVQVEQRADSEDDPQQSMIDVPGFVTNVTQRASGIEQTLFSDIREAFKEAVRRGSGNDELERVLQSQFNVAANRVRFVARDGMGNLNTQISRTKHQALGFTHYIWVSSEDQRVRPEHARLNGTVRKWSDPHPTEGHPGDAYGCRCVAVPVMPDQVDENRRMNALENASAAAASALVVERFVQAQEEQRRRQQRRRATQAAGITIGAALLGVAGARVARSIPGLRRPLRPGRPAVKPSVSPAERPAPPAEPARRVPPLRLVPRPPPEPMPVPLREAAVAAFGPARVLGEQRLRLAHDVARRVISAEERRQIPAAQRSSYATLLQRALRVLGDARDARDAEQRLVALARMGARPYRGRRLGKKRPKFKR